MIDRAKSAGVSIFQGGQKVAELSKDTEAITVPAKESIVVLSGSSAKFDGEPLPLIRTGAGSVASLDLSRSAGFHLLETADHARYWLATEDGKLKATEILRMLELLETLGLSWGGQLFFSDGSGLQDNHVQFAWLRDHGLRLVDVLESVARSPRLRTKVSRVVARERAPANIGESLRLYRRDPRLLEARPTGPIALSDGRRFAPRQAISRFPTKSFDTSANKRAVQVATLVLRLCETLEPIAPGKSGDGIRHLSARLRQMLLTTPWMRQLSSIGAAVSISPIEVYEELVDGRYGYLRARHSELVRGLGWSPSHSIKPFYAFVRHIDEIYQAFVALVLARALGCKRTHDDLRPFRTSPSFSGGGFELYYDTQPPPTIIRSWRIASTYPDSPRPDLLLVRSSDSHVLLLDAKYRRDGNRVTSESLREVQYYLNAFDLKHVAICYPPVDQEFQDLVPVEGRNKIVLQIPISPRPNLIDYTLKNVVPTLTGLLEPS